MVATQDLIMDFIRTRRIDSFQKLYFLLFLHQHPDLNATSRQLAEQLYLGDLVLLDQIIDELQKVGLVDCANNHCCLHNRADIRLGLQCMASWFEDPQTRQMIIDQVRRRPTF